MRPHRVWEDPGLCAADSALAQGQCLHRSVVECNATSWCCVLHSRDALCRRACPCCRVHVCSHFSQGVA